MVTLRPFEPNDLSALYFVSLATGHEGGDASSLYGDPRLIGHIYSAPYALLDPDQVILATDEGGVAGFVAGAIDTASWEEALERGWWPRLRNEYADPSGTSRATWTADQRRAFMIHHPQRTPSAVAKAYPRICTSTCWRGCSDAALARRFSSPGLNSPRTARSRVRMSESESGQSRRNPVLGGARFQSVDA